MPDMSRGAQTPRSTVPIPDGRDERPEARILSHRTLASDWRVALRRDVALAVALKLVALALLWALFFRN